MHRDLLVNSNGNHITISGCYDGVLLFSGTPAGSAKSYFIEGLSYWSPISTLGYAHQMGGVLVWSGNEITLMASPGGNAVYTGFSGQT